MKIIKSANQEYARQYIVYFNGGGTGKTYRDFYSARMYLREAIESAIAKYGNDFVNLEDCEIIEYFGDTTPSKLVYCAADDNYFDANYYDETDLI